MSFFSFSTRISSLGGALMCCFINSSIANADATYVSTSYSAPHAKGYIQSRQNQEFIMNSPHSDFTSTPTLVAGKYSLQGQAGPVEDQGQCGSCWDFSLTSVLRGTFIMAGHDSGRLSFNYLLNCATDQLGCNGGDFNAAAWFTAPKGAPAYGSDGSYTAVAGTCVQQPIAASSTAYHMLGTGTAGPSFKDIAYVISVLRRPVSIDVAADGGWQNYSWGTYNGCSSEDPSQIDHMVTIEGYDCEGAVGSDGNCIFDANGNLPAGVGTWTIRNSWGTSWGMNGYIVTKATDAKGLRCNAVATTALYFDIN